MATTTIGTHAHGRTHVPNVPPRSLNLDPVLPVLGRMLDIDFIRPIKMAIDCLDSGPLLNVCIASLKSIPHAMYGDNRVVREFDNAVSCRLRYLETACMSTASLVYNVAFGLVFSVASLVTLGQVNVVLDQMRKHWTHTALATGALGISVIGTLSPDLGIKANVAGLFAVGFAVLQWMQGDVITKLSSAYQRHNHALKDAVVQGLQGDRAFFHREFDAFFNHLDTHLNDQVHTLTDLMHVAQGAGEHLPNVVPVATADGVMHHLEQVLSHWRSSSEHTSGAPTAVSTTV